MQKIILLFHKCNLEIICQHINDKSIAVGGTLFFNHQFFLFPRSYLYKINNIYIYHINRQLSWIGPWLSSFENNNCILIIFLWHLQGVSNITDNTSMRKFDMIALFSIWDYLLKGSYIKKLEIISHKYISVIIWFNSLY